MIRLLFGLVVASLFPDSLSASGAYPIPPCPLRVLMEISEVVAVGQVAQVEWLEDGSTFEDSRAVLKVSEVLQGELPYTEIAIHYSRSLVCPAPPHFEEKATVLVFINPIEDQDAYYVQALSYGAKTLDEETLKAYKQQILRYQPQLGLPQSERRAALNNWIFECLSNRYTCAEALQDLAAIGECSYGEELEEAVAFTADQQSELLAQLAAVERPAFWYWRLINLLAAEGASRELYQLLADRLRACYEDDIWLPDPLIKRLAAWDERQELKDIAHQLEQLSPNQEEHKAQRTSLIKAFVLAL